MSLLKIKEEIKKHKSFLIATHVNPEGDALGSELALAILLEKLGKQVIVVNDDQVPQSYRFLPGIERIRLFDYRTKKINFDCLIVVDCAELARAGEIGSLRKDGRTVLNIDHHISNTYFADYNWVEPDYSSTAELIYQLYRSFKIKFDPQSATLLYVGLLTDTGSFRYSNTTSLTHKIAADLLNYKINPFQIYEQAYENIPYADMVLLSKILPQMKEELSGKIIWFQIKRNLLVNRKVFFDLNEHVLGFGRAIRGVEVVVLFKENLGPKNEIKISFRSQGKVDVNKIAALFGGGGHRTASGCTTYGNLDSIRRKVIAKVKEALIKK